MYAVRVESYEPWYLTGVLKGTVVRGAIPLDVPALAPLVTALSLTCGQIDDIPHRKEDEYLSCFVFTYIGEDV